MNLDRRQFIQGILAAGVVAVGAGAVTAQPAQGATLARTGTALSSAESFLLATGRRAHGS